MRDDVRVVAVDIFGTAVDWHSGISMQVRDVFARRGVEADPGTFASQWRAKYLPSLAQVNAGEREWAYLDTLHRESLDALLAEQGADAQLDDGDRRQLVLAWHHLPAWPDTADLLTRLRRRYTVVALSNGGFAMLVDLVKSAGLPVDAIVSAELTRSYKPAPAPYRTTAELLDVEPGQVLMLAAHAWDIAGAADAGLATAFLERPGEKGPTDTADRAADVPADIAAETAADLAATLRC